MRAATLFSGIGAPEAARPDWDWLWSAEIEPFPSAVLAARHPGSVNLGDVTSHDFAERALAIGRPDVLVFGSPCQSFSVAGKRLGLDDPRGNLALVALGVVRRVRPRWIVFENVPGLLSSAGGEDFAAFLAAVQECGYLGCWRVLDARHWGLAQRRQRVFFVGCLGDWRGPAAVLSLTDGLRGYPETGREAREGTARPLAACPAGGSGYRNDADTADNLIATAYDIMGVPATNGAKLADIHTPLRARAPGQSEASTTTVIACGGNDTRGPIEVSTALNAHGGPHGRLDFENETFVATTLRARDGSKGVDSACTDTLVPVAYACQGSNVGEAGTLRGGNGHLTGGVPFVAQETVAIPILESGKRTGSSSTSRKAGDGLGQDGDPMFTLGTDSRHAVAFHENQRAEITLNDTAGSLKVGGGKPGQGYPAIAVDLQNCALGGEVSGTLDTTRPTRGGGQAVVGFHHSGRGAQVGEIAATLQASDAALSNQVTGVIANAAIRRLLPSECEKLMGFESGYTAITYRGKEAADGPRYRCLGNSMAVPVLRWLLTRIEAQMAALAASEEAA